ncbi:alcohol dehydrogenase catalytic domain-containing protein [Desulfonema magnum]|uniref:Alcohol dehydrogenase n=1 Tax=Desulfonema magnum TaxID=45655 RepID=A0A975BLD6_9BACT|nr:alcohol dehydrogenase catalytic domain-containing protein [Desulfonema magnum]QTA87646.1 Alcohol dehydrogenase [Desulfonema magnum]
MNSLQLEKIGSLKLKPSPLPEISSGEILLKVTHCAVCRTDAKMWERGQRDLVLPRILGHEICGVSEQSKKRFVVWPGKACGHCQQCRRGSENLCREMEIMGFHKDGGFAEYAAVPESSLIPVPDDLAGNIASLAEPLACTLNALEQAKVRKGDRVLIYGAGPVGLMAGLAAHAQKAFPFIKDISPEKLRRSADFQKQIRIENADASPDNPGGFDVVINAAPSQDTFLKGLSDLRHGGRFCLFSGLTDESPVPVAVVNEIHYRQLQVTGAYGCTRLQMKNALKLLSAYKDEMCLLIDDHIELAQVPAVLPKILEGQALKFIVKL